MVLKRNILNRRKHIVTPRYKSLQFNEAVKIEYVEHVNDLDDETFHSIYYNSKDYKKFKREAKLTAEVLRSKFHATRRSAVDSKVPLCPRGLERYLGSKRDKLIRAQRVMNARTTVLQEQEEQKKLGMKDPVFLAGIYMGMSKSACKEAYNVALQDQEEVQSTIDNDDISTGNDTSPSSDDSAEPTSSKLQADSSTTDIRPMSVNRFLGIRAMIPGIA